MINVFLCKVVFFFCKTLCKSEVILHSSTIQRFSGGHVCTVKCAVTGNVRDLKHSQLQESKKMASILNVLCEDTVYNVSVIR